MEARGGWKPVFRRRQGRYGTSAAIYMVFVDDLPNGMNPKSLYVMFSKFGVIKDAFIPNKRRRA
ncbi:hypothetical protein ACSBR2_003213 [Camellia fascicularis]